MGWVENSAVFSGHVPDRRMVHTGEGDDGIAHVSFMLLGVA